MHENNRAIEIIKSTSWRGFLFGSIAALAVSHQALAQMGGIRIDGLLNDNGKIGGMGSLVLPIGRFDNSMFYTSLQGGWVNGEEIAGISLGYRANLGSWMAGAYVGADAQGLKAKERFWGINIGGEVSLGGLGVGINLYIPVKKEQKLEGTGYKPELGLYDPENGNPCPGGGAGNGCVLAIQGRSDDSRRALLGGDVNISYRLPLPGMVDVVPYGGVYMFENDIKGWQGGIEISAGMGGGWMVAGGAKMRHDQRGSEKILAVGLQFNFGSAGTYETYTQRKMNQAPRRLRTGVETVVKRGNIYGYEQVRVEGSSGGAVGRVFFVDNTNQQNAAKIVGDVGNGGIVVFRGNITASQGQEIEVKHSHVALLGAGTTLNLLGVNSGKRYQYTFAGARPTILQADGTTTVISSRNNHDLLISGLDVQGGKHSILLEQTTQVRVSGINSRNAEQAAFNLQKSDDVHLDDIFIQGTKGDGLYVDGARNFHLSQLTVQDVGGNGIRLNNINQANINNLTILRAGKDGFGLADSSRVQAGGISVDTTGRDGFNIVQVDFFVLLKSASSNAARHGFSLKKSHHLELAQVSSNQAGQDGFNFNRTHHVSLEVVNSYGSGANGINFFKTNKASLLNIEVHGAGKSGLIFQEGNNINLAKATINDTGDAGVGFAFTKNSNISNIEISGTKGHGMVMFGSDQNKLSFVAIKQAGQDGFHLGSSQNIDLKFILSKEADGNGITMDSSSNIRFQGLGAIQSAKVGLLLSSTDSVNGTFVHVDAGNKVGSIGIKLVDAGKVGQENALGELMVENADHGFQIDRNSAVRDLGNNRTENVKKVCDAADAPVGLSVNRGKDICR
ncbi:MAG: right-handed parallel beta-helix repeat-containing protein [Alphaproteobacteria bacterium]|nr:right-handed parallel beta-helix repeat-containing protein [Alphaproteobacteria bacterium]